MTELVICGQAPSRVGDGRPFTGPSGKRLAALFGLGSYEELASKYPLANIFDVPAAPRKLHARRSSNRRAPGDQWDAIEARKRGVQKMERWAVQSELVAVLACGHNVYQALTAESRQFFEGQAFRRGPVQGVDVWCFPHPSGASQFWNDEKNRARAAAFLKRLQGYYGMLDHE